MILFALKLALNHSEKHIVCWGEPTLFAFACAYLFILVIVNGLCVAQYVVSKLNGRPAQIRINFRHFF